MITKREAMLQIVERIEQYKMKQKRYKELGAFDMFEIIQLKINELIICLIIVKKIEP